ncbi:DUF2726 domain-containing protein [Shewanella benthica]|uniref:DUF2726 domain-containing protein n=1 Tax=Shewanella benthica KT99 TaxID=314608 RepID=A9CW02_9GAMM|nr:DUF2726 domain-containing protein [Shewanella benthica]EDQ02758.1 hypothetical protein KT99_06317 [Shewanella benthica KT99]MBE7213567.1 DUF2726 domain-containing protein [Shewanella benthica]MCL1063991.1 DUF2726 domain-containing protein [Shewanella benthica]
MNATVILSYTFMYFVLFVIVPFVIVTFVMTCIKFFQTSDVQKAATEVSVKPHLLDMQSMQFLKTLKTIAKGRYDVLYDASLVNVVDIDQAVKNHEEVQEYMEHCHLDYVVVDNESSSVKLVMTNPEDSTSDQVEFIEKCLAYTGIQLIKLDKDKHCDEALIRNALAA